MPTLAAETSVFPIDLLNESWCLSEDRRWWAMRTKARQEKSLARELLNAEIPFYLPLVRKYSYTRGRKMCAYLPLFTGYVFLYADEEDRVRSLKTNRTAGLLSVVDQDAFQNDLRRVSRLIDSAIPLTLEERLEPGQRVRIKNGTLQGVEGTLLMRRGGPRLLVAIDFLQQGASLEIFDYQVEPL